MRVLFTIAIVLFLLGGTYAYTRLVNSIQLDSEFYQVSLSDQKFSLEINRTFTAVPSDDRRPLEPAAPILPSESIRILFKGQPLLVRDEEVPAGEPLFLEAIPEVEQGINEIFVFARLRPPGESELAALQVRILRQKKLVAEATFPSQTGSDIIYGTLVFDTNVSD